MVNNWTSLFPSTHRRTLGLPSPTNSSLHSKYFHLCIKMTFLLCSFTDFPRWHPRSIILIHRTKPFNYPSCIIHWPINSWPTHDLIWQTLGSTCGNLPRERHRAGPRPPWASWGGQGEGGQRAEAILQPGPWALQAVSPAFVCSVWLQVNQWRRGFLELWSSTATLQWANTKTQLQEKHLNWQYSQYILQVYFNLIQRQDCNLRTRHCSDDRNKTQLRTIPYFASIFSFMLTKSSHYSAKLPNRNFRHHL